MAGLRTNPRSSAALPQLSNPQLSNLQSSDASADRAKQGFTLIELMIVIAVLVILMGLMGLAVGGIWAKAKGKNTEALIQRIDLATQGFQSKVGRLPNDGIDSTFKTRDGTPVQSSAALYAQLSVGQTIPRRQGGQIVSTEKIDPFLSDLTESELSEPYPFEDKSARDILDSWGSALHYDNVRAGFSPQNDASVHLSGADFHGPDVRTTDAVPATGGQNKGGFDVWSHGPHGHEEEEDPSEVFANFPLSGE